MKSGKYELTYKLIGNKNVLLEWPNRVDTEILDDVIGFRNLIKKFWPNLELISAYNSILLIFHETIGKKDIVGELKGLYASETLSLEEKRRLWKIPVLYGGELGIDMKNFSEEKGMTADEVINLHTSATYTVFCIGFLPGFLYLGGLDPKLHHPRRTEPRLKIPKGSVGIGGEQTGVYPQESPGGWNIIGNSPVKIFDPSLNNPCPVNVGDKVKFHAITIAEYKLIKIQVEAGVFKLKSEKI